MSSWIELGMSSHVAIAYTQDSCTRPGVIGSNEDPWSLVRTQDVRTFDLVSGGGVSRKCETVCGCIYVFERLFNSEYRELWH